MKKEYLINNTENIEPTNQKRPKSILLNACLILSIMFLGISGFLFTGCGDENKVQLVKDRYVVVPYFEPKASNPVNQAGILNANPTAVGETATNTTTQGKQAKLDQWRNGEYTYSQFYLGYIENVPIDYQTAELYDGVNGLTLTYTSSVCTEKAVESSLMTCEEVVKSSSNTVSGEVSTTLEGKFNYLVAGGRFGVSISAGWEGNWTDSKAVSTTETYTTAETYTEENTFSVQYTINSEEKGHYRFTLFGTTDVYGIARTKDAKNYEIDYAFCARPESYFYALDYSKDNKFNISSTEDIKLELKAESLENLTLIEEVPIPINESYIGTVTYDSSEVSGFKNRTRYGDDENYYGMNTAYADSDKLDMSEFKQYFYEGFVFEFKFTLTMNMRDYGGTQEFYLYNSFTSGTTTNAKKNRVEAKNRGLVAEKLFNYDKGKDAERAFTMRVPGNVVHNTMFTKFGASGDGENKWIIANVKCTTNIYRTNFAKIYSSENGKEIKHDGAYGLKCVGNKADKIDLSDYKEFMNDKNYFLLTFSFKMHEKDDGSQEIYLYDNNTKESNGTKPSDAEANGFVRNLGIANAGKNDEEGTDFDYNRTGGACKTDSWIYFSVQVSGEKLKENMYLRYDANGDDGDTWVLKNVHAYITVLKK